MTAAAQDQTRGDSVPFFQDDQPAPLSCNEVSALCMKAARGVGMSWGLAEEAGFAASWLVSHGIDGPSHMCAHLAHVDREGWDDLFPQVTSDGWRNRKGRAVCPIVLGATLSDYADLPDGPVVDAVIHLGPVSVPILLVPFLAELARDKAVECVLTWECGSISITADAPHSDALALALGMSSLDLTLAVKAARLDVSLENPKTKALTTANTIATLNALAMRTTVPATEASRAGAGSSLSDND